MQFTAGVLRGPELISRVNVSLSVLEVIEGTEAHLLAGSCLFRLAAFATGSNFRRDGPDAS